MSPRTKKNLVTHCCGILLYIDVNKYLYTISVINLMEAIPFCDIIEVYINIYFVLF